MPFAISSQRNSFVVNLNARCWQSYCWTNFANQDNLYQTTFHSSTSAGWTLLLNFSKSCFGITYFKSCMSNILSNSKAKVKMVFQSQNLTKRDLLNHQVCKHRRNCRYLSLNLASLGIQIKYMMHWMSDFFTMVSFYHWIPIDFFWSIWSKIISSVN